MKQYKDTPYFVDTEGNVYRNGRKLKGGTDKNGYKNISLWIKGQPISKKVHRIIAETYIPNPNNLPQINHINGIKTDNSVRNLEWTTPKENMEHAVKNNLLDDRKGINNHNTILSDEDVLTIRKTYIPRHKELGARALSRKYKVSYSTIQFILSGKNWKHL